MVDLGAGRGGAEMSGQRERVEFGGIAGPTALNKTLENVELLRKTFRTLQSVGGSGDLAGVQRLSASVDRPPVESAKSRLSHAIHSSLLVAARVVFTLKAESVGLLTHNFTRMAVRARSLRSPCRPIPLNYPGRLDGSAIGH